MVESGGWLAMVYYVLGSMTNLYDALLYIFAPKGVKELYLV